MRLTLSEILFGRRLPEFPEAPPGGMLVTEQARQACPKRWDRLMQSYEIARHDEPHMIYVLRPTK